jgi:hypothetical protein
MRARRVLTRAAVGGAARRFAGIFDINADNFIQIESCKILL